MDEIRGSVGKPLHDLSRDLERLPVRYGGLGLTSPIDIAPHAFLASRACASRVLRQRPGLNIPAQFRSDFNTKPQDTTTARAASSNPGTASTLSTSVAPTRATDVSTIPPQRSLVDTFVHQRYHCGTTKYSIQLESTSLNQERRTNTQLTALLRALFRLLNVVASLHAKFSIHLAPAQVMELCFSQTSNCQSPSRGGQCL